MTAVGDATQFQAARSSPFAGLLKVAQIGAHIFYRFGGHAGAPAMFHQAPATLTDSAKVELARLEPAPAAKSAQPVSSEGRIKVTLYPGLAPAAQPAAKPENTVQLVSAMAAEPRPAPVPPLSSVPAQPATPSAKAVDGGAAKPAVISVALAQS